MSAQRPPRARFTLYSILRGMQLLLNARQFRMARASAATDSSRADASLTSASPASDFVRANALEYAREYDYQVWPFVRVGLGRAFRLVCDAASSGASQRRSRCGACCTCRHSRAARRRACNRHRERRVLSLGHRIRQHIRTSAVSHATTLRRVVCSCNAEWRRC